MDLNELINQLKAPGLVILAGAIAGAFTAASGLDMQGIGTAGTAIVGGMALMTWAYHALTGKTIPKIQVTLTDHNSIMLIKGTEVLGDFMDIKAAKKTFDEFS
jgi:hypothetical protein